MLYKIKTTAEIPSLPHSLPKEVISEAERVAEIPDDCYNSQGTDGGYILIAETKTDLTTVKCEYLDYANEKYEFMDSMQNSIIPLRPAKVGRIDLKYTIY